LGIPLFERVKKHLPALFANGTEMRDITPYSIANALQNSVDQVQALFSHMSTDRSLDFVLQQNAEFEHKDFMRLSDRWMHF
jgi:hypothetical protein